MRVPKGGVAFFDSGIGGLTVLAECEKLCSNEIFYYYGDHAHAPYGNLSEKKIRKYVFRVFRKFNRLKVKAAVVACNTATAVCIERLREKYSFPIIGAEPAVFSAAKQGGEVYVLSTRATFSSERFRLLCEKAQNLFQDAVIVPFSCDGLAGEIEGHITNPNYDFTKRLPRGKPSSVVLGCTHYIYIGSKIAQFYGCKIYDGNEGIARRLKALLKDGASKNWDEQPPSRKKKCFLGFLTTFNSIFKVFHFHKKKQDAQSRRMSKNVLKTKGKMQIFFLGENKSKEMKIYEQMFVSRVSG